MNTFKEMSQDNFFNTKRVLITGGAGFIGGALVRRLLLKTKCLIFNIDKLTYASNLDSINQIIKKDDFLKKERYTFLKCDLFKKNQLEEAFKIADPDIVFNFAAETHVDRSIEDPINFLKSNIFGTYNLLENTRKHYENLNLFRKKSFRFHHISTDEVFGSLGEIGNFDEDSNYDPRSPYSATKAASDHIVMAWHHTYKIPSLITNCSNNYGPWQFPEKLIPLVILKALAEKSIPIYGNGLNVRDWLYVEDHIDAIILVVKNGKIGNKYCIGGHGEKNNKEVVNLICEILNDLCPKNYDYKDLIEFVSDRPSHDKRYAINPSKIQKELGWKPNYDFKKGIYETVVWYLNNQKWCDKIQQKANYNGERIGLKSK